MLEQMLRKVPVFCTYNGAEMHVTRDVLKTPLSGHRLTSSWRHEITFATVHVTDADVSFFDGPGLTAKSCINSSLLGKDINGSVNLLG